MARKARIEFAGGLYHVLDRGDRQEPIVRSDGDRAAFVRTFGEACIRAGWRVHAFVLMSNQYHLLIETPQANLVAGMRWFQTTWTVRFNRFHAISGQLFQGRYKAVVVDPEERGYFASLSDYIHLNPVRAGMVGLDDKLFAYQWSTYPWYVATAGRPSWFEPVRVLGELGFEDSRAGRRAYAERMRGRAVEERLAKDAPLRDELRRGVVCWQGELSRTNARPTRRAENARQNPAPPGRHPAPGAWRGPGREAAWSRPRLVWLSARGASGAAKERSAKSRDRRRRPTKYDRDKPVDRECAATGTRQRRKSVLATA